MNPINFSVDKKRCISCEACVSDCPLHVLTMAGDNPVVISTRASMCIGCLHCLTICPVGAVSMGGFTPDDCLELKNSFPEADKMEALIRGRRSIRQYKDEDVEPEVMERLMQVAWQAPTGVNSRGVLFTVVDNGKAMNRLRSMVMDRIAAIASSDKLPESLNYFAGFAKLWKERGVDILFRGAPHIIVTSASKDSHCPEQDCIIALAYFELFAQSLGLGTVWDGMARRAFAELMPDILDKLGIPADHTLGYVMAFGKPAVEYHRTIPIRSAAVNKVSL